MNNSMVAHLWANEKKESARGSNFFFEGRSIYSYGYHFEVGRIKEMKGGGTQIDSVTQNTMRYSYRKEGDLIPAYMSHELGEILPSMINISKSKIWDDWLQLTQYFPNRDSRYYEAAYVRYNAYDSPTEVYSGFGETEAESRAMLLFDLLEKKILTPDGLNLKEVDRRKEYENEFE